jgi:hypothetical protein
MYPTRASVPKLYARRKTLVSDNVAARPEPAVRTATAPIAAPVAEAAGGGAATLGNRQTVQGDGATIDGEHTHVARAIVIAIAAEADLRSQR